MKYEIMWDEEAIDFLNILPKTLKERIFKKINNDAVKEDPFL